MNAAQVTKMKQMQCQFLCSKGKCVNLFSKFSTISLIPSEQSIDQRDSCLRNSVRDLLTGGKE